MHFISLIKSDLKIFSDLHNKMFQFLLFFQPLLYLTIFHFLGNINKNMVEDKSIIISIIISMWGFVLYSSGSALMFQKWNNTLELIIASPTTLFEMVLSKCVSNSLKALLSMVLTIIYAFCIFKISFHIDNIFLFILSISVFLISLSAIGVCLSILFALYKNVYEYQDLLLTPVLLLCGIFIPVNNFPILFKFFSYLIPMTWSIKSIYASINTDSHIYIYLIFALLSSIIYIYVAKSVMKYIDIKLRKTGEWGEI